MINTIDVLAAIIIAISLIKLVVLSISPKSWLNFAEKIYVNSKVASSISFVLAAVVLYLLVQAEITIVEILAVMLFTVLLIMISLSKYTKYVSVVISGFKKKSKNKIWQQFWPDILIWFALLMWGLKELLF